MMLLAPLGLLAGALLGPLVLWYVLRSRRPRRVVSSTLLFTPEHQTASAAVPWQPFRADRTFWLVALAVLLGAAALARPAIAVPADVSDHTILIIDASASMQAATADGPSRLEVARRTAADLIDRAGDGRVSVIEASVQGRVLADARPARDAARALDRLRASDTAPAMDQAMTLAGALVRPGEDTVIHLITDGGVDDDTMALVPRGTVVDTVGTDEPNIAVAAVGATPLGGGAARVLVELASFSDLAVEARVGFVVGDKEVRTVRTTVPPRGRVDTQAEISGVDDAVVQIRVTLEGAGPDGRAITDAQPHDDRAWVVLPDRAGVHVLVVGPPNPFLDAVLAALPDVTTTRRSELPARLDDVDVLVVDRAPLPRVAVPTVAIAPTTLPEGVERTGTRELPTITQVDTADPLLADVDLARLGVAEIDVIEAPTLRKVVDGPGGPLLLAGRLDNAPTVLFPFELSASNLPLEVAFPVLMANAMQVLAGPGSDTPLVAGADRSLPLAEFGAGATTAILHSPAGAAIQIDRRRPTATLDQTGIWRLEGAGSGDDREVLSLAVNPDVEESDLTVSEPEVPATAAAGPQSTETVGQTAQVTPTLAELPPPQGRIELSRWLLLAAAVLFGIELAAWAWQHRRPATVPA